MENAQVDELREGKPLFFVFMYWWRVMCGVLASVDMIDVLVCQRIARIYS